MERGRYLLALASLAVAFSAAGCHQQKTQAAAPEPPVIPVSQPIEREVTDYVDYTGRTDAVESVGIRARVSGYLIKMPYKEGDEVKAGDLLFEIDPRPYQAMVDQAKGQLAVNEAQLKLSKANLARDTAANQQVRGAITLQQIDQDKAAVDQAAAMVQSAEAVLAAYELNLSFTKVYSPINGQVSRYYYTLGNLVNQDQTLLTTVVSVDPMYAYFDLDERTLIRVRKAINEGKIKVAKDRTAIPVLMGLEGEEGYPHHGTIDFINNVVNPSTGTIAVRGVFQNPLPPNGRRILVPGMFVRIRLPIGQPHQSVLIADRAIGSDQGLKYAYVVDAENKVQYRRITTGALENDGLRVVEEGIKPDDWVIVGALLQVRPQMEVKTDRIPMPTLGPSAEGQSAPTSATEPQAPAANANEKKTDNAPGAPQQDAAPPQQPAPPDSTKDAPAQK